VRVGIYGGSFDPPHVGHIILATDACERLRLDLLLLVPAHTQPFKTGRPDVAAPQHRLEMLRMSAGADPRFRVEPVEIERGGLSYTVDTLEELAPRYPGAELFLIVGEDAVDGMHKWRRPERIRELVTLTALRRNSGERKALPDGVLEASCRVVEVASSEIRERIEAGKSIRGFVIDAVDDYIRRNGLYR